MEMHLHQCVVQEKGKLSQAEEQEEVLVFSKNVLEMFWFLRKITSKGKPQSVLTIETG